MNLQNLPCLALLPAWQGTRPPRICIHQRGSQVVPECKAAGLPRKPAQLRPRAPAPPGDPKDYSRSPPAAGRPF